MDKEKLNQNPNEGQEDDKNVTPPANEGGKVDDKQEGATPPKQDDKSTGDDKGSGKTDDKPNAEGNNGGDEGQNQDSNEEQPKVDELEEGNAVPLSEVVLKSDLEAILEQRLGGLNAKIDALIKENEDLKAQNEDLSKQLEGSRAETNAVKDKYENNGDFGGMQPQGGGANGAPKNESWRDYSSQYLK